MELFLRLKLDTHQVGLKEGRTPRRRENLLKQAPKDSSKESLQGAKGDAWEINLKKYKILGTGEVKNKLIITAKAASKSAIEKVKKMGGEIILLKKKEENEKKVVDKSQTKKDVKSNGH